MSTRSTIGFYDEINGKIQAIYCHFDGYVKGGVGEKLYKYYQDKDKVKQLISLGNLSSLGNKPIDGGFKYWNSPDFDENSDDYCVGYRFRYSSDGDPEEDFIVFDSEEDYEDWGSTIGYTYLFKNNNWFVNGEKLII